MSKEQLEKAKKILNHIKGYGVYDGNDDIEIFEWLIEQAKRAQKNAQDLEDMDRQLYSEQQQNKRYREALEFYADRDNYKLEHFDPNLDDYMSTVDYDEGQKARQTIGSEKIND